MYKYKVIVADDEPIIRKSLYNFLNSKIKNIECVAVCENGEEVIEILNSRNVDVIISDIKMPLVTGIDIAKYVFEKKLPTKIILISGYNEFDYALKAINYGVSKFITKPIEFSEMTNAVNTTISDLENLKTQILNDTALELGKQEITRLYLSLYYNGLIPYEKVLLMAPLKERISEYEKCAIVDIAIASIDENSLSEGDSANAWIDVCEISNRNFSCYCINQNDRNIQMLCYLYSGCKSDIIVKHFEECKQIMNAAYGIDFKYELKAIEKLKENNQIDIEALSLGFVNNMANFNQTANVELINVLFATVPIYNIKKFFYAAVEIAKKQYNFTNDFLKSEIEGIKTLADAIELCEKMSRQFYYGLDAENVIKNVVSYIESHYGDQRLDINYIADEFELNRSYLSRIFKQQTGKSPSNYIYDFRIEKAKQLLKTQKHTIKYIAFAVGYGSERYFGQAFKKATGLTPSEYAQTEVL